MRGVETVLVAPDKFKGSLSAEQVAEAIAAGLEREAPRLKVIKRPVADGGEGTLAAVLDAGFARVPVVVHGPTGELVRSAIAVRHEHGVVELADCCGLRRLPGGRPAPLDANTVGLGEAILAALDAGCTKVTVAAGGSASTDAGLGMLSALGVVAYDACGVPLPPTGAALTRVARLDTSRLDARLRGVAVTIATDVANPLHGPDGAARLYAAQKGADSDAIELLETGLKNVGRLFDAMGVPCSRVPGAGAAGGVAAGAIAVLGAAVRPGAAMVLDILGFQELLRHTDLVITGEGSLDRQTLQGKLPAAVARLASAHGAAVIAVAGRVALSPAELSAAEFSAAFAIQDLEPDPHRCMVDADVLLQRIGAAIGRWTEQPDQHHPGHFRLGAPESASRSSLGT